MTVVRPYPWRALQRVPRRDARRWKRARELGSLAFAPGRLPAVLSELVGDSVTVELEHQGTPAASTGLVEVSVASGVLALTLGAEPHLVQALLERVLARPFALPSERPEIDATLRGAFAALALETARRVALQPVSLAAQAQNDEPDVTVQATVRVGGRPYRARVRIHAGDAPTSGSAAPSLGELGELLLRVPLVVGMSFAKPGELRSLSPGAAFVPGEATWIDRNGVGAGVLAAATAERGVRVDVGSDGRIVLRGETLELVPERESTGDEMTTADDVNQTLTDAALEAPVVVRVELGAVSMTARDWALLRPGDVIETGQRIAEPVLLRIGGRAVAHGELVDVDGQLGVRVRELLGDGEH